MKIVEIDLTGSNSLYELHERIRVALDFPEWYGRNWDAFWDLLWSECDADKIIIKGGNTLSSDFDEDMAIMRKILERNKNFEDDTKKLPVSSNTMKQGELFYEKYLSLSMGQKKMLNDFIDFLSNRT